MAVRIRLKRIGKVKRPFYRIVVADSRTKRDGKVIEQVGKYHPVQNPSFIEIDSPRAQYLLSVGAKPTQQALALLKLTGDWARFCGEENPVSRVEQPVSIEAGKSAPKSRRHSAPVAAGEATPTVSDRSDLPSVSDTPQDVPEDVRGQA
ncbi:30S ribosomal protein S16 [Tropheryma whipplei]|uniref:30S ribosomal protein S16 n=1 Tax=Tropheryma whipplei TaxID=2039 RepID=UPI0004B9587A|nr:30S ribosomal protein S16 [Tropheryma whipplei]